MLRTSLHEEPAGPKNDKLMGAPKKLITGQRKFNPDFFSSSIFNDDKKSETMLTLGNDKLNNNPHK